MSDVLITPPPIIGGRYIVGKPVGSGSSGSVFLCRDRDSGRQVAVKVREGQGDTPVRFVAEARDMAMLQHPRLVPVLDSGVDGNYYWYTMPFYARGSMRDRIKVEGAQPVDRSLAWMFQILEGLSAVHGHGLVHRDVKPHNVMLDDQDEAVITDFGLVRHMKGDVPYRTRTDQSMGTPNYRAPEQAVDAANADIRADVYGAGATLYFLIAGKRPGFLYMLNDDDDAMKSLPQALRPVVLRCMAYSPTDRYPDARSTAVAIAALYDQLPERSGQAPVAAAWMRRFDRGGHQGLWDKVWSYFR